MTDGCAGLAAALQTVYPRLAPQRCRVQKRRNLLQKVGKRTGPKSKAEAQAIYLVESRAQARAAFRAFRWRWGSRSPQMARRLGKDLPELLAFFDFPEALWKKLRSPNLIERGFVEVRRRTRPMGCFVDASSVDRSCFQSFTVSTNRGRPAPSEFFHKQLDVTELNAPQAARCPLTAVC